MGATGRRLTEPGRLAPFAYAAANPSRYVDPLGLDPDGLPEVLAVEIECSNFRTPPTWCQSEEAKIAEAQERNVSKAKGAAAGVVLAGGVMAAPAAVPLLISVGGGPAALETGADVVAAVDAAIDCALATTPAEEVMACGQMVASAIDATEVGALDLTGDTLWLARRRASRRAPVSPDAETPSPGGAAVPAPAPALVQSPKPAGPLKKAAAEIREAGVHPAARNQRVIAVGEDEEGSLHAGSSNGFDAGQRAVCDRLGVCRVPTKKDQHAEENLLDAVPGLKKVGTSKRDPCGPDEHNCAQKLRDRGVEVEE